jgi:hypothetical protein
MVGTDDWCRLREGLHEHYRLHRSHSPQTSMPSWTSWTLQSSRTFYSSCTDNMDIKDRTVAMESSNGSCCTCTVYKTVQHTCINASYWTGVRSVSLALSLRRGYYNREPLSWNAPSSRTGALALVLSRSLPLHCLTSWSLLLLSLWNNFTDEDELT